MAIDRVYGADQFAGVKVTTAAKSQVKNDGTDGYAQLVAMVDASSGQAVGYQTYTLASNQTISSGGNTTPVANVAAGSYILAISASNFNASTIKLQSLLPDGVTWADITGASTTANTPGIGVVIGGNSTVRLAATGGAPTGVYATLS